MRSIHFSMCIRNVAILLVLRTLSCSSCFRPPSNGGTLEWMPSGKILSISNSWSAMIEYRNQVFAKCHFSSSTPCPKHVLYTHLTQSLAHHSVCSLPIPSRYFDSYKTTRWHSACLGWTALQSETLWRQWWSELNAISPERHLASRPGHILEMAKCCSTWMCVKGRGPKHGKFLTH